MSFSDFGGRSSAPSTGTNAGGLSSGLEAISEKLSQYQRNVGILEKIVQSLSSRNALTVQQYEAQNHVLEQLQLQTEQMLAQQPKHNSAAVKLQRDFQRVRMRVAQLQESATRRISAAKTAVLPNNHRPTNAADENLLAEQHKLQQLQLQEDRLQEDIMREREEEIRSINKGMHTVNEIYKDLAHIVGQQQEQIDTIETQMDDAAANAQSGLEQVEKANDKYGSGQCRLM